MAFTCIIVDDEQHAIDILQAHIAKIPNVEVLLTTTNPIEAFGFVQSNHVDLIFLDIEMPDLNGLEFLKLLKEKCKVILTTAYREHALEGYEHNISDYLLKPVLFPRFLKAINRVLKPELKQDEIAKRILEDHLFVKTGIRNKVVKIEFEKIHFIESMGNYVHFNMKNAKISCLMPLKEVEKLLPSDQFMRIHQSYIIPKKKIIGREGNQVLLDGLALPIGESYRKGVFAFFQNR